MIKIEKLTKTIRKKIVLDDINAQLKGITGIIGPNGAGKTTLMKIIAAVSHGDKGTRISYEGKNEGEAKIGYSPQNFNLYPSLTVSNVLQLLSSLNSSYDEEYIKELLAHLNLEDYKEEKMKNLSGGTLQRVGIAQALLNKPNYLIIDEPTTGLDIVECIRLRDSLLRISKNVEIIISSHIPEDITFICNHLLVIDKGKKVYEGNLESLINDSEYITYEGIVKKSKLSETNKLGHIVKYEKYDDNNLRVRFITKQFLSSDDFCEVVPDFLSGYVGLLKDGIKDV